MTPEECRTRRAGMGLSPYQLAMRAGLAERTVVRFESADVVPRPGTLIALRRALRAAQG